MEQSIQKHKITSRWTALGCLSMPLLVIEWVWRNSEYWGLELSMISGLVGAYVLSVLWQSTEVRVVQMFCPEVEKKEDKPIIPYKSSCAPVRKGRIT